LHESAYRVHDFVVAQTRRQDARLASANINGVVRARNPTKQHRENLPPSSGLLLAWSHGIVYSQRPAQKEATVNALLGFSTNKIHVHRIG
jgi:hypothetical protein